jgi:hypothetical protein
MRARSNTLRCREIAGAEMEKGFANSETVQLDLATRIRIWRRTGSASA